MMDQRGVTREGHSPRLYPITKHTIHLNLKKKRTVKKTSCAVWPRRAMAFRPCGVGQEMRTRK